MEHTGPAWASNRQSEEVLGALRVSREHGLDAAEAQRRHAEYGPNRLQAVKRRSALAILAGQLRSVLVALLAVAAALAFVFGNNAEGIAVLAVLVLNTAIGFTTELRAVRSMEALRSLGQAEVRVRRGGQLQVLPAEALVPGDIVQVQQGDAVNADIRLLEASRLQVNESALTGEAEPASKQTGPLEGERPPAERTNMLFKGTTVTRGAGEAVVVGTGMRTELGHISQLVEQAEPERTPLERRLQGLGRQLFWVALLIAAGVAVLGVVTGRSLVLTVQTAIALAVATVPEGLPIIATIVLARGVRRMARRHVLVNRLSAVETLGTTTVTLCDKTGTLTESQMTAARLVLASATVDVTGEGLQTQGEFRKGEARVEPSQDQLLRTALEVAALCNDAVLERDEGVRVLGDPTDVAMLVLAAKGGLEKGVLLERQPLVREEPFDPGAKRMATVHRGEKGFWAAVKGAPEALLEISTHQLTPGGEEPLREAERHYWQERNEELARGGLRVLALATRQLDTPERNPYEELTFVGLVGLHDPPRADVADALAACRSAGIQVVMVTGDQPHTAVAIARAIGLQDSDEVVLGREIRAPEELSDEERGRMRRARIFSRVTPEQKLQLVSLHQQAGAVVAMTGDGVNDAPALKQADIGIAMGQRGTDVARQAADMVLQDDAFSSIVAAVRSGRIFFDNIRAFILYLLACNLSELLVIGLATAVRAPLPLLPLQILFLNLVTDVFPALALGLGAGNPEVMRRPPRDPRQSFLTRSHWKHIILYGALMSAATLGAMALAFEWLGMDRRDATTVSFLTLALVQLWHVFNVGASRTGLLRSEVVRNGYVWGALALCTGLLLAALHMPWLAELLRLSPPGARGWAVILAMSLLPLLLGQIINAMRGGGQRRVRKERRVRTSPAPLRAAEE